MKRLKFITIVIKQETQYGRSNIKDTCLLIDPKHSIPFVCFIVDEYFRPRYFFRVCMHVRGLIRKKWRKCRRNHTVHKVLMLHFKFKAKVSLPEFAGYLILIVFIMPP